MEGLGFDGLAKEEPLEEALSSFLSEHGDGCLHDGGYGLDLDDDETARLFADAQAAPYSMVPTGLDETADLVSVPPARRSTARARPVPRAQPPPPAPPPRADAADVLRAVHSRWLVNAEVLDVLLNARDKYGIVPESEPAHCPGSGSLLLFERSRIRGFRLDGHEWRKKKNGLQLAETHEKLKVDGELRLVCYYSQTLDGRCAERPRGGAASSLPPRSHFQGAFHLTSPAGSLTCLCAMRAVSPAESTRCLTIRIWRSFTTSRHRRSRSPPGASPRRRPPRGRPHQEVRQGLLRRRGAARRAPRRPRRRQRGLRGPPCRRARRRR